MSSIADALSTLSDRGLRRLLGARTFLRGLDYEKRRVVSRVQVNTDNAVGTVKGTDKDPYSVCIRLGGEGITSECSCPAFQKSGQHCKHVAALLITVRNQARADRPPRDVPSQSPMPSPASQPSESKSGRRRERRRRAQAMQAGAPPGVSLPSPDASAKPTGMGAWLAPDGARRTLELEFRAHVRQGGLTVTVLDLESRTPLLPSVALTWQALSPTQDRDALRILVRFESGNPRHPAVDIRGEDVSDLLRCLKDSRVLLEPALMQLRFDDEPLAPQFDLEMVGSETIVAKATFRPSGEGRPYPLTQGGWFEGSPGWHVDTTEGVARPIDTKVSPAALRRLIRSPTIAERAADLIDLVTNSLPKVALEVGAPLPDLSQVADVIDLTPEFRMRAGGNLVEASVSLRAAYGDLEVEVRADGMSPPVIVEPPQEGQKRAKCIRTDIVAQQQAAQTLISLNLTPNESGESFIARGDDAIQFWSEGIGSLPESWELYVPEELVGAQVRAAPVVMSARVSSGMDWLNLKVSWESDGVGVTRSEIEQCLREGRKYVRLSDNSFAPLDADRVKSLMDREIELMSAESKAGKLPLSQAGRVQELLAQADSANIAAGTKQLFKKLESISNIKAIKKPAGLKATLRPYQKQGLAWLRFVHDMSSGGVLADDMGLGKTIQTIALFLSLKPDIKNFKALIVAPTSVVNNWKREIERFAPSLTTALWHGAGRKEQKDELSAANIIITSYALLRRDIDFLKNLKLDYAILDEAQNIKNPYSATAQAAKDLTATRRLALTGTPIENRLTEIWSIFEFVSPGLLGPLKRFEEKFARPIDQGDSKKAARLRAVIHPFILRRTKNEVAKDLPPKIESNKIIDLPKEQRAVYTQLMREVRAQVMGEVENKGLAKSQIHILAGLTKLRQAACDPRLLGLPRQFSHDDSGKLAVLRELMTECESGGHKVLIFSQFVQMLKLVRSALDEDKVRYEYLDGSTTNRQAVIDRFQEDPTVTAFLISLKAGGSGLNLTAADTVIHFDPWWNPAVEDQASDRAHRIGQRKVVTVYRLVAAGTIEEKILQLKDKKRQLVASVLTEDSGGAKKLTKMDLDDLFRVD
ncbi:MAG: SNF2 helicase associated domain-containing protein [Polyangiaceae bacterium]|nr:SNF2 helicase associated domain-containing protein [Polyangiaceae bacterium]